MNKKIDIYRKMYFFKNLRVEKIISGEGNFRKEPRRTTQIRSTLSRPVPYEKNKTFGSESRKAMVGFVFEERKSVNLWKKNPQKRKLWRVLERKPNGGGLFHQFTHKHQKFVLLWIFIWPHIWRCLFSECICSEPHLFYARWQRNNLLCRYKTQLARALSAASNQECDNALAINCAAPQSNSDFHTVAPAKLKHPLLRPQSEALRRCIVDEQSDKLARNNEIFRDWPPVRRTFETNSSRRQFTALTQSEGW